ncbi:hypothetical protein BDQ17DRAFT_1414085 [Cyathus striatus]|nr:hypothetical protein BDQ17DRAFT_1414085 [Cyathus striatus]
MDSFPLENLPIEIVIDIFDEACQNYRDAVLASVESELEVPCPYEKRHCRKKPLVTPVSLSQVCRIWKEVVFSTPKLWDTIHLVVDTRKYGDDKEMYMKCSMLLKKWLQRTGAVPLTMIIGEYAVACKEYGDGSIMEQIIERIGQCKFLNILQVSILLA